MTVDHSSARKRPLAPDLSQLDDRSVRAWTEAMAVDPLGGGLYEVDSQSGSRYVVDLVDGICSCPDSAIRGERCKHLRRTALEVTQQLVPPPGMGEGPCRDCGREEFVSEDMPDDLCPDCAFDAGDLVRDKETDDTLIVRGYSDRIARDEDVPGTAHTVSTYPANTEYPEDDAVVLAVYPRPRDKESREYAFPHSRLEQVVRSDDRTTFEGAAPQARG